MKKGTLRRLTSLLVCLAMLLSGLSFADELGGVVDATEPSTEHSSDVAENSSGDNDSNHTAGANAPAKSDPKENQTSDVFVSETDGTSEDEAKTGDESKIEDESEAEDAFKIEDESETNDESETEDESKAEDESKIEDESKTESGENEILDDAGEPKSEDVSDLLPGEETDQVLSTLSVNDANLEDGIMPIMELPEGHTSEHTTVVDYSEPLDEEDIIGWANRDEDGHSYLYQVVTGKWCEDCCEFVEGPEYSEVSTSKSEPHEYYEGVCTICGYACKHTHRTKEGEPEKEEYYVTTASTHQKFERTVQYYDCVCDTWPLYEVIDDERAVDPVPVPHDFSDGDMCECGYEKPEEGAQEHDPATHDWQYIGRVEEYVDCVPNDDGATCIADKRKITYEVLCQTCEDLGNESSFTVETEEQGPFTLNHSWGANGVCEYCGYTKDCEHENRYITSITRMDAIAGEKIQINNDGTHTGKVRIETNYTCPDCGKVFSVYEVKPETAPHEFYPGDSYTPGVCKVCGYKCNHEHWVETGKETIPAFEEDDEAAVKDDEKTHHYPYSYVCTIYWCPDCEQEYTVAGERQANSVKEPHEFDLNGYCLYCGYHDPNFKPCKHRNYKADASEFELVYTATCGVRNCTPTTHDLLIEKYYAWRCPDCGRLFDGDGDDDGFDLVRIEYEVLEKQPHEWTTNGYCSEPNCGYKNPCAHEDVAEGEVEIYATVSQIPGDAANHLVSGVRYTSKHCNTCGQDFDLEFQETFTNEKQAHEFVNGACEVCGYESGSQKCDHTDRTPGEPKVETSYEPVDDEYHNRIVSTTPTEKCNICGEVIEGETTTQSFKEAHGAGYDAKDGVCSLCKHECSHADRTEQQSTEKGKPMPDDDDTHTPYDTVTTTWKCPHCQKTGEEVSKDNPGTPAQHSYALDANGKDYVCSECGHKCEHTGVTPDVKSVPSYLNMTDVTHDVVTTITTRITCNHGHAPIQTTETKTETGVKHTYEDSMICKVCHHTCQHENPPFDREKNKTVEKSDVTITELADNDAEHQLAWSEFTSYICPYCKQVYSGMYEPKTATEAHKYKEGVCTVEGCGHACMHTTVKEPVEEHWNDSYKSNGAKGHSHTYDVYEVVYCKDCGLIPAEYEPELIEAGVTVANEKHSFKNGKCTLCGYEKPAEQDQPEQPVVKDEPVYEEVAQGETVHGVTVGTEAHMTETLTQAIQGIQAEYGESAQLAIRDAEKVIPQAEFERFTKIDPVEQMMVLLMVIGFDDEVERGMTNMGIALSEDALALAGNLQSWAEAMSPEERAAFQKLIEQFFPLLNESGEERVEITLEITRGDSVRLERYAFERVNGEWVFTKLEVANI